MRRRFISQVYNNKISIDNKADKYGKRVYYFRFDFRQEKKKVAIKYKPIAEFRDPNLSNRLKNYLIQEITPVHVFKLGPPQNVVTPVKKVSLTGLTNIHLPIVLYQMYNHQTNTNNFPLQTNTHPIVTNPNSNNSKPTTNNFPLLQSLGIVPDLSTESNQNTISNLLSEIVKLHRHYNKTMSFNHIGNDKPGLVVLIPKSKNYVSFNRNEKKSING